MSEMVSDKRIHSSDSDFFSLFKEVLLGTSPLQKKYKSDDYKEENHIACSQPYAYTWTKKEC